MKISSRLAEAIHIILAIDKLSDEYKITSELLSGSLNINPVLVRQILVNLNDCNITKIVDRKKGVSLIQDLDKITVYDIYKAVKCVENDLFGFHSSPNPKCPIGSRIHLVLDDRFEELQNKFEDSLKEIKVSELSNDLTLLMKKEG